MRAITNDDIWSAVRGLQMYSKTKAEVLALYEAHKDATLFAGRVIAEAARQVALTKKE